MKKSSPVQNDSNSNLALANIKVRLDLDLLFSESPLLSNEDRNEIRTIFEATIKDAAVGEMKQNGTKRFKLLENEKVNEKNEKLKVSTYIVFQWDATGTLSWKKVQKSKVKN